MTQSPTSSLTARISSRLALVGRALRDIANYSRRRAIPARPYVLAGVDFGPGSAGVKACHRLVHELNEHGMAAYSIGTVNPDWNETQISRLGVKLLRDPIAIYPEVVHGNPLGTRSVVRWALNAPGHLGGDPEFAETDLVFAWSTRFYDTKRILTIDVTEHELFNSENLPAKTIDCFYMGKAADRGVKPLPITEGMTEITRTWPATRKELADLMRRSRTVYSYDDCTAIGWEALLCGCRVIILPEGRELTFEDAARDMPDMDYEAQLMRFIGATQVM